MSQPWAVRLPASSRAALAGLRLVPGLRVCAAGDVLWLAGDALEERLALRLRQIPGGRRYTVLEDGQLLEAGCRVPAGHLPDGPWHALARWITATPPTAALPGRTTDRVPLRLVPSTQETEANVLCTTLTVWEAYAATAPQVRLARWAFAVDDCARVLVRGQPLPPIPGRAYVEREGVAVPAGWSWQPAVEPVVVRAVLEGTLSSATALQARGLQPPGFAADCAPPPPPPALLLWDSDNTFQLVPAEALVAATRSAVRLTAGGSADG